jgi:hypothetical protein
MRPDGTMMVVPIETTPAGLEIGAPQRLFTPDGYINYGTRNWDIAPDGRFLIPRESARQQATDPEPGIFHVLNWLQDLQRRVPLR